MPVDPDYEFEYTTIVTDSPVNLEGINSAYDDYNSDLINSTDDQLGPLSYWGPEEYSDFDICYTHHLKSDFGTNQAEEVINSPDTLMVISSDWDDLYPSFTHDQTSLFFCSNRENGTWSAPVNYEISL